MYRRYSEPTPRLIGYDPVVDLPLDHLARLIEEVVEQTVRPAAKPSGPGQPAYDPRLCIKVLVYGYATGVRSSRQLERMCAESLAYLFLTRGDTPSYRTLCTMRRHCAEELELVWVGLLSVADKMELKRLGRVVVDSSKLRANAGGESVVAKSEYTEVLSALREILAEAEATDAREDEEGSVGATRTGKEMDRLQMRDILRNVRRKMAGRSDKPDMEKRCPSPQMVERIRQGIEAIEQAEQADLKHSCLTDPDSRMMPIGTEKRVRQGHMIEVALDRDTRLLVAGGVQQQSHDHDRLEPLVDAAAKHEPSGIVWVDADCGYFKGNVVAGLIEAGVDVCVPDSHTAGALHRGEAVGPLHVRELAVAEYDEQKDLFRCVQGNELTFRRIRLDRGQEVREYRARRSCRDCPHKHECIGPVKQKTPYKTLIVHEHEEVLQAHRARFNNCEMRSRYRERGAFIEGVFGFIVGSLGFRGWLLRGRAGVGVEGMLMCLAYQVRKLARCKTAIMARQEAA